MSGEVAERPIGTAWVLQGFTSNVRYATAADAAKLKIRQPALNRPEATCAALIPLKKNARWWDLSQDERRAIFEETSHHAAIGLEYLPAIARRRLRPILMTALTTIFGMLPLALCVRAGAQLLQLLAIAVIGGVAVSMILSLVITPVVLSMVRRSPIHGV